MENTDVGCVNLIRAAESKNFGQHIGPKN